MSVIITRRPPPSSPPKRHGGIQMRKQLKLDLLELVDSKTWVKERLVAVFSTATGLRFSRIEEYLFELQKAGFLSIDGGIVKRTS